MDHDDKAYYEPDEPIVYTDRETGESYTRHPLTGVKHYIEDEPTLLSNCCGSVPNGELDDDNAGRCDWCQEMALFTEGE